MPVEEPSTASGADECIAASNVVVYSITALARASSLFLRGREINDQIKFRRLLFAANGYVGKSDDWPALASMAA
jgi:hypothetical protein